VRYIVFGAGAVGGTIGGRLLQHGHDVVLIARGAHLDALRAGGLELRTPEETLTLPAPAVGGPEELTFGDGDVVLLAMKTQDTAPALRRLAAVAPASLPVVCAQNGVENERLALRHFERVYGMCVMLPGTHLEPGVVEANGTPHSGILDLGRYPHGSDGTAEAIASDLASARFSSKPVDDIMRWKYRKLVMNLANALEAACGPDARRSPLYARARDEAMACFAAAGIDVASEADDAARRGDLVQLRPVGGRRRQGGSSWQSLARGTGSIEADHLNGEIVLLGRLLGVPTPANAALQHVANRMAHDRAQPGSVAIEELEALVDVTA
jgi:2-dehydropantoate 2-reductase